MSHTTQAIKQKRTQVKKKSLSVFFRFIFSRPLITILLLGFQFFLLFLVIRFFVGYMHIIYGGITALHVF